MSRYNMSEMLYAVADGAVVPRRKSIVLPLFAMIFGVALLVVNVMLDTSADNGNLRAALLLFGAIFALTGGALLLFRLLGMSRAPYCVKDACFLNKSLFKFSKEDKNIVVDLVRKGDFDGLHNLPKSEVSALIVVEYSSPKSALRACQVFEYIELELRPVSDLVLKVE